MICPNCGKENPDDAYFCPECGAALKNLAADPQAVVPPVKKEEPYPFRSKKVAVILCLFLGWCGIHRFYVGKYGTGIFYMFTCGGFFLGWFLDLFNLFCDSFRDKNHYPLM